jgi:sRNA-binding protein
MRPQPKSELEILITFLAIRAGTDSLEECNLRKYCSRWRSKETVAVTAAVEIDAEGGGRGNDSAIIVFLNRRRAKERKSSQVNTLTKAKSQAKDKHAIVCASPNFGQDS